MTNIHPKSRPPPPPPRNSTTLCEGLGTQCWPTALLWLGPTRTMVAPKNPALHNLPLLSVHMASGMPHPLVVEVHQHTCLLVRQLLTSSKLKDHSFLRPLSMWYILVLPGLQAIPFEMHTSVTFRVRVCVTGGRGREGERITLGGVPVCM